MTRCPMFDWVELAATATDAELREKILTGFKDGKPFTPYVPTLALPVATGAVLDFGCGLGRNFPYLTTVATRVTGYDLPAMIDRCRRVSPVERGPALERLGRGPWDALRDGVRVAGVAARAGGCLPPGPRRLCRDGAGDLPAGAGARGFRLQRSRARGALTEVRRRRVPDRQSRSGDAPAAGARHVPFDAARSADDPRHFEVLLTSRVYRS